MIFLFVLILIFSLESGYAAKIPWSAKPYSYVARSEDLSQVLSDFFSSQGIPAIISKNVKGKVSGRFIKYPPKKFFYELSKAFGLVWYFDGAIVYIYSQSELQSRLIRLRHTSFNELKKTLFDLGIYDKRFPVKAVPKEGLFFVAGPKKYIDLIADTAYMLDQAKAKMPKEVVRVFPLKYAWATDHTFVIQNQKVTVPGVATILNNILSGQVPEGVASPKVKQLAHTAKAMKGLRGKGLISIGKEEKKGEKPKKGAAVRPVSISPRISADARLNAVIVRDIPEKMPIYKELISILDVPSGLVQIEVTILDVSTDKLRELGLNWRLKTYGKKYNLDVGLNTEKGFRPGLETISVGEGLNFAATISLGAGKYFLSKLKLLEEKGEAKILSRPSVLTVDNVQAVIEQTSTFYVRVAGYEQVDLFNVTAGIILKVTPHIIVEKGKRRIKLLVDIEDGEISTEQTVDRVPVVPKSSIHTQAVVNEDEILLLGGYIHESKNKVKKQVPILGSIPIIGWLFKHETEQRSRRERIFMIQPRIINTSLRDLAKEPPSSKNNGARVGS